MINRTELPDKAPAEVRKTTSSSERFAQGELSGSSRGKNIFYIYQWIGIKTLSLLGEKRRNSAKLRAIIES